MVSDRGALEKAKAAGADAAPGRAQLRSSTRSRPTSTAAATRGREARHQAQAAPFTELLDRPAEQRRPRSRPPRKQAGGRQGAAGQVRRRGRHQALRRTCPSRPRTSWTAATRINGGSCSAGFNLRNPSTGQGYLLTAGHCVSAGSTLTARAASRSAPCSRAGSRPTTTRSTRKTNKLLDPGPVGGHQPVQRRHRQHHRLHRPPVGFVDVQVRHHHQVDLRHHHRPRTRP